MSHAGDTKRRLPLGHGVLGFACLSPLLLHPVSAAVRVQIPMEEALSLERQRGASLRSTLQGLEAKERALTADPVAAKALEEHLPPQADLPALLEGLKGVAEAAGVELVAFEPSAPRALEKVLVQPVRLQLAGTYRATVALLRSLEDPGRRLLHVRAAKLVVPGAAEENDVDPGRTAVRLRWPPQRLRDVDWPAALRELRAREASRDPLEGRLAIHLTALVFRRPEATQAEPQRGGTLPAAEGTPEEKKELESQRAANAELQARLEVLVARTSRIERLRETMSDLEARRPRPGAMLEALALTLTPPKHDAAKIQLERSGWNPEWDPTTIRIETVAETDRRLLIEGVARSLADLSELMTRLETWPFFASVQLIDANALGKPGEKKAGLRFRLGGLCAYGSTDPSQPLSP